MAARPPNLRGYLLIAAAAFCWGASATLGKAVFNGSLGHLISGSSPIDPLIIAQSRTSFAFLMLAPYMLLSRGLAGVAVSRRDLLRCAVVGILGVAGSNFFYYFAIDRGSVATAIVVQYTAPMWVFLYMLLRGRDRATPQRVGAVALAVAGSAAVVLFAPGAKLSTAALGIAAAFCAAFSYSIYNIGAAAVVGRLGSLKVMLYALGSAALFWICVNPPWKIIARHYSESQWLFLVLFSAVSMLVPYTLYFTGLKYLDPTRAIVTSCLEPVFAIAFTALFVGERVAALQILGMGLVLVATVLIQRGTPAASAEHA